MNSYNLDMLVSLLVELRKNKIDKFSEIPLEKDIFYYIGDPKYKDVFKDGVTWVDFSKEIEYLESLGYIKESKWLLDCFCGYSIGPNISEYPIASDNKMLFKSLAKDYAFRERICKNSSIKLKIYGIDPNNINYKIIKGYYECNHNVDREWRLLSDALNVNVLGKRVFFVNKCYDSINPYVFIDWWEGELAYLELENANFAIEQGFDRKNLKTAIIYTKSFDEKYLRKLVNYNFSKSLDDTSAKVLSLSTLSNI